MNKTSHNNAKYCADLIRAQDYGRYLQCAYAPKHQRDAVLAYYALNAELAHVPHVVTEEMIGHIRYAWWQEAAEGLYNNTVRDHPVLQLLAASKIAQADVLKLVATYREVYPEAPKEIPELPVEGKKWLKAGRIIDTHEGGKLLLLLKLILA